MSSPSSESGVHRSPQNESFDDMLRELARTPMPLTPAVAQFMVGENVAGHFRIERILGQGAMGIVFLAQDEQLQRQVALKIHTAANEEALVRLEREGRALAHLSHPNVLAIHEVGKVDGRFFIATEYVDGGTAGEWVAAGRAWREVVGVYLQAARGLAAAHDKGLVHRDFKPANVLVGNDGRVRVADFGLAQQSAGAPDALVTADATSAGGGPMHDSRQTIDGARASGTPAYMAPEQRRTGRATAASDQYSLFVALYEALYEALPFEEVSGADAAPRFPSQPRIPRRLRSVIARGLSRVPEDRFESLEHAIAALERATARTRSLALGAVALLGVAATTVALQSANTPKCDDAAEVLAAVWSPEVAAGLRAAFVAASPELGDSAWGPLELRLQAWADRWIGDRDASCRATHVAGTQSPRLLERSMLCFDERKAELAGVLAGLASIDRAGVPNAWSVIPSASSVEPCTDALALDNRDAPEQTPEQRRRALALAEDLQAARAEIRVSSPEQAEQRLVDLMERAEALGDPTLICETTLHKALAGPDASGVEEVRALTEAAYVAADRGGAIACRSRAAANLARLQAIERQDSRSARVWLTLAMHSVESIPEEARRFVTVTEGLVLQAEGHYAESAAVLKRALASTPADAVADRFDVLDILGASYDMLGEYQLAREAYEAALELAGANEGARNGAVASTTSNLGLVLKVLGEFDAAVEAHQRCTEIFDEIYGPGSLDAALCQLNLVADLADANRCDEALERAPRVLEAVGKHQGARHTDVALVLEVRGLCLRKQGRLDEALADFQRARSIQQESAGDSHPQVAAYSLHAAATLVRLGRHDDAVERFTQALEIWEALDRSQRAQGRLARAGRAGAHLSLGSVDEARRDAEAALASRADVAELDAGDRVAMFVMARLQRSDPARAADARALADRARASAVEAGDTHLAAEIAAWLATPNEPHLESTPR
ncbi:MAG: serine/threonine-protein kinase [Myxococcota bacterium]